MKKDIRDELALAPGQSLELLQELHILTREGRINQDSRRKLKQVHHLVQFIEKLLLEIPGEGGHPTLADHGAGKSYLGFILYDLFFQQRGVGHIYGIETRAELVERSRELARRLGFERMSFLHLSAADAADAAQLPEKIDVVTGLHACDTATDDAIAAGVRLGAEALVVAPCCHHELAAQLATQEKDAMLRHGLLLGRQADLVTDALRAAALEMLGYRVDVIEFVSTEHTAKNVMLRAERAPSPARADRAAAEYLELRDRFGVEPAIERLLTLPVSSSG
jgi:hypothetical protein